jgi:predicted transglutaminase-like cysteine proteinase
MRNISKTLVAAAVVMSIGVQQQAEASLLGAPQALRGVIQRIKFDAPTVAPMAFTMFCLKYTGECKPQHRMVFRGGRVKLTAERWAELNSVNRGVNAAIRPEHNAAGLAGEKWLIGPSSGDCNDYAVTKRHDLIARGWSARSVLLSEVVVPSGEHHLVVVVRTNTGDLVLDNLSATISPWQRKPYQWVRIQMPKNPNYWASLNERNA